jgi:tRNA G18 (ribose-2'-O)-methylase SpoU
VARVVRLTDIGDERLRDYVALTDVALRRVSEPAAGLFIAESAKVVARALAAGYRPRSALMSERWLEQSLPLLAGHDIDAYVLPEPALAQLTGFAVHRGLLAAMNRQPLRAASDLLAQASPDTTSRVAVFEDLVDHTNLGAAMRSAAAFGVDAVLITPSCADPLYRRAIRVSMGTVFQVPWTRIDPWPGGIDLLRQAGYFVAGMTLADDATTLDELAEQDHPKLALIFGTEGDGLSRVTSAAVDVRVKIPMMGGVDSLNVAASSAVAFYALSHR